MKNCPMMFGNTIIVCKGEKCAWWDEVNGNCCIKSTAISIDAIVEILSNLRNVRR